VLVIRRAALKTREWKTRYEITGVENVGVENPGVENVAPKQKATVSVHQLQNDCVIKPCMQTIYVDPT